MGITCDICNCEIIYPEGWVSCRKCGATHCPECYTAADKRGDYSPDYDWQGEETGYVDCSYWKECLACKEEVA